MMNRLNLKWIVSCLALAFLAPAPLAASFPAKSTATLDEAGDEKKKKKKKKKSKKKTRGFSVGPGKLTRYEVDTASDRNEVTFTSKAPKETITGKTKVVTGHLELKPRSVKKAKGAFSVAWQTLDTGRPMMNAHMMAAPWVDAGAHPEIVFSVTAITDVKRKTMESFKCKLNGTLTMNGAEKKLKVPATLVYIEPKKSDAAAVDSVKEGIGVKAKFTIGLADFNINGKPGAIGTSVARTLRISVSLFLKRVASEEKPDAKKPRPPGGRIRRPDAKGR